MFVVCLTHIYIIASLTYMSTPNLQYPRNNCNEEYQHESHVCSLPRQLSQEPNLLVTGMTPVCEEVLVHYLTLWTDSHYAYLGLVVFKQIFPASSLRFSCGVFKAFIMPSALTIFLIADLG